MDLRNLQEHYRELTSYMETHDYAEAYIRRFRLAIDRILAEPDPSRWSSYADIYEDYKRSTDSANYLKQMRTIIGAIEQFDIYGHLPNARRRHSLFGRGAYPHLLPGFKELVDVYRSEAKKRGNRETSICCVSRNAASFLYHLQSKGFHSLEDVTEDAVLSFFLSEDGTFIRGSSYKNNVAAVLRACLEWKDPQCHKILSYLPAIRSHRKNVQYLTTEEVQTLRHAVEMPVVSSRNKAVILLLIFTGLRSGDVAGLTLSSIDWSKETVSIVQQKTDEPLELPLPTVVGNAIYDYLTMERPDTGDCRLFLSETWPYLPMANNSIENIVAKVFRIANIRQSPGDRKGTHIFRHKVASSLLENGVPQPIISQTLGHADPKSLEAYLHADFVHLKQCSLSLERFPVAEEVFSL